MMYLFAYRPPNFNKGEFFNEILNTLSKALKCYDNIVLAGDPNIDLLDPSKNTSNHLSDLLDVFNLKNLVKKPTCFMSDKGSLIGRPDNFPPDNCLPDNSLLDNCPPDYCPLDNYPRR